MKYAFVLDSVACIPEQELNRRPIKILPLTVTFEDISYVDTTEEKTLIAMHNGGRISIKSKALSITPKPEDIRRFILKKVAVDYNVAICQTIGKAYTPIYDGYKTVAQSIAGDAKHIRTPLGIEAPFRMSVFDTGSLAAGQGLIALYADDLMKGGLDFTDYRPIIEDFSTLVKSFTVVRDSIYIRHRVKLKGNKTVSFPVAFIANALSFAPIANNQNSGIDIIDMKSRGFDNSVNRVLGYCSDRVLEGLVAPLINISFAGDPKTLIAHSNYKRLQQVCDKNSVALYIGAMTLAASINLGPGALSIAIAPINQDIEP
jgi:fatty acid-binding protein DegV